MIRRLLYVAAVLALLAPAARADVKPHPLFSDGMVLQQKGECFVWGTADPGEKVEVTFKTPDADQGSGTTADQDGKWKVSLKTGTAGGPYTLTIKGKNEVTLKDVYVGEVWVASGQSNMEQSVNSTAGAEEYKKNAKNPKIRLFTVDRIVADKPQSTVPVIDKAGQQVKGKWLEAGPDTIGSFSAVAYHFGRHLNEKLDVPIGIIHASWGGTIAEAWTPKAALEAEPSLKHLVPAEIKLPEPGKQGNPNQGTALYNGMIAPLLPYSIKGAIWYQGESNAGRAYEYQTLFPTLIQSWRDAWKNPDMPFLFVQLAPWRIPVPPQAPARDRMDPWQAVTPQPGENAWAELREAQRLTSLKVKNTGMAVITDVGDAEDIHPRRKDTVGIRLAIAARAIAYGEKVEYSGPVYKSMDVDGNKVVLHFTHVGQGLDAKYGVPLGFTVAGEDRKFYTANAEIKGDTVVVSCDKVQKPMAVRYGWANCPLVDFGNRDGLPAPPFRTDDFPMITKPK
jgi:sialate O-acetylesterase